MTTTISEENADPQPQRAPRSRKATGKATRSPGTGGSSAKRASTRELPNAAQAMLAKDWYRVSFSSRDENKAARLLVLHGDDKRFERKPPAEVATIARRIGAVAESQGLSFTGGEWDVESERWSSRLREVRGGNSGWIPLLSDWEGNHIGVDLEPGPSGKVGQVINFGRDEEEKYVLFPSVVDLVEWLATEYESKRVEFDKEDKIICHVY
jgi:hypothetical protein